MATTKRKTRVRSNGTVRSVSQGTSTTGRGFLTKKNRHIVEPATASQIMRAVGIRKKDLAEVRRLIAKYAPLESLKPARRR